jgi:large subunit ribosomal protein L2
LIGLVCYRDGERRYTLLPKGLKVGDEIVAGEKVDIKPGNRLPLKNIPVGTFVYAVELKPLGGAKIGRSAGNYAQVVAQDYPYTHLKMPSTEVRKVLSDCFASVGSVSNEENWLVNIGKAGRNRWLGKKPKVRASARNPVDHLRLKLVLVILILLSDNFQLLIEARNASILLKSFVERVGCNVTNCHRVERANVPILLVK